MFCKVYLGYLPVWIKGKGSNGFLELTGGRNGSFISILFFFSLFLFLFFSLFIHSISCFIHPYHCEWRDVSTITCDQ